MLRQLARTSRMEAPCKALGSLLRILGQPAASARAVDAKPHDHVSPSVAVANRPDARRVLIGVQPAGFRLLEEIKCKLGHGSDQGAFSFNVYAWAKFPTRGGSTRRRARVSDGSNGSRH